MERSSKSRSRSPPRSRSPTRRKSSRSPSPSQKIPISKDVMSYITQTYLTKKDLATLQKVSKSVAEQTLTPEYKLLRAIKNNDLETILNMESDDLFKKLKKNILLESLINYNKFETKEDLLTFKTVWYLLKNKLDKDLLKIGELLLRKYLDFNDQEIKEIYLPFLKDTDADVGFKLTTKILQNIKRKKYTPNNKKLTKILNVANIFYNSEDQIEKDFGTNLKKLIEDYYTISHKEITNPLFL
jgi:hypothetical protein